jgi:ribulose-phosphate 3-epimerase
MQIYPAILTDSTAQANEQLATVQEIGDIETVQIDIIDGRFADNLTISPADFTELEFGELTCDLHIMTEEPMDFVFELLENKNEVPVRAVIGQVERMSNQHFFLEEIQKHEWLPGLSLDLFTPVEAIDETSWQYVKVIQLMGVEAGFQGQKFNDLVIEKIVELHTVGREFGAEFEVIIDGGITLKVAEKLSGEGIDGLVVGSAFWNSQDKQGLLKALTSV